jgi:hypothetical protein
MKLFLRTQPANDTIQGRQPGSWNDKDYVVIDHADRPHLRGPAAERR